MQKPPGNAQGNWFLQQQQQQQPQQPHQMGQNTDMSKVGKK